MARFYFNIFNDEVTLDDEGQELPNAAAARARGIYEARNLAAHSILSHGHLFLDHRIDIADETGSTIATVAFGDAVEVRHAHPDVA